MWRLILYILDYICCTSIPESPNVILNQEGSTLYTKLKYDKEQTTPFTKSWRIGKVTTKAQTLVL